jgi:hypothetical protein
LVFQVTLQVEAADAVTKMELVVLAEVEAQLTLQ